MNNLAHKTESGGAKMFRRILILLCLFLAITDFKVHRHGYFSLEETSGFYPIVALLACFLIIGIGKNIQFMVKRREDYYDN